MVAGIKTENKRIKKQTNRHDGGRDGSEGGGQKEGRRKI